MTARAHPLRRARARTLAGRRTGRRAFPALEGRRRIFPAVDAEYEAGRATPVASYQYLAPSAVRRWLGSSRGGERHRAVERLFGAGPVDVWLTLSRMSAPIRLNACDNRLVVQFLVDDREADRSWGDRERTR